MKRLVEPSRGRARSKRGAETFKAPGETKGKFRSTVEESFRRHRAPSPPTSVVDRSFFFFVTKKKCNAARKGANGPER